MLGVDGETLPHPAAGLRHLQEKDADYADRHGFSKHKPALPLYTEADAVRALDRLTPIAFEKPHQLPGGATIRLRRAGHILGAASIELEWDRVHTAFSCDIGRYDDPMMVDPVCPDDANYLLIESTYGDRRHDGRKPEEVIAQIIERTVGRGGTAVIPAFAVGRAQALLFYLHRLKTAGRLANVPVFLDSPMDIDASAILCQHLDDHRMGFVERNARRRKALHGRPRPSAKRCVPGALAGRSCPLSSLCGVQTARCP